MFPNPVRAIANLFVKIFHTIQWFIVAHFKACFVPLEPVIETPEWITTSNMESTLQSFGQARVRAAPKLHLMFLFPFLVEAVCVIDSAWVMYSHHFDYFNEPMPELLSRKIFPHIFRYFGDQIVLGVVICSLINYAVLLIRDFLDERYVMYVVKNDDQDGDDYCLIVNGKVWDKQNGSKIIEMWRKSKVQLHYTVALLFFVIASFYNIHYLSKPITSWKHYLTYFLFLQEFLWYTANAVVFMFCQFFLATNYLLIRQKFIVAKQKELLLKIKTSPNSFYADWRKYLQLNTHLAYLCNEVRAYNRFWGIILTTLFCSNMWMISYFSYCCIYFSNYSFEQIFYFVFYMFQLTIMLFGVIYRCSKVDEYNDRAYELNMKTCVLFQLHYRNCVTPRQLANIEKIASNRNFSKCCFRLSNGYRLDSSAFNLAVCVETSLFLMLVKRNT